MTQDDRDMLMEIQAEKTRRWQEGFAALIAHHGGIEGWHAACHAHRAANPDHALARIIRRLIRRGGDDGNRHPNDHQQQLLLADPDLAAYWQSVADAGEDGWREERRRLSHFQRNAAASTNPEDRLYAIDTHAIEAMMPEWRTWGRAIKGGVDQGNSSG